MVTASPCRMVLNRPARSVASGEAALSQLDFIQICGTFWNIVQLMDAYGIDM